MDSLVFNKFDLKRTEILEGVDRELLRTKNGFATRGVLHSGSFAEKVYEILADSAKRIIDGLLDSYGEVQKETTERILVIKEKEIVDEVRKLIRKEDKRVYNGVAKICRQHGLDSPKKLSYFYTNLREYALTKAKILIDTEKRKKMITSDPNLVFIACGQSTDEEKKLGKKIEECIERRKLRPFLAESVQDLTSLNTKIFKNLNLCSGFIGVLHKRKGEYQTSVWINQEIAIFAFLNEIIKHNENLLSVVFIEEGLELPGLMKYTIANPITFGRNKCEDVIKEAERWLDVVFIPALKK